MSDTHRAHVPPSRLKTRGGKLKPQGDERTPKTHKQRRPNQRVKLRREYL